jgi:endo-1,4-beta-xylanase
MTLREFSYPVGFAKKRQITNPDYLAWLVSGSTTTFENEMKFHATHPSESVWTWDEARAGVNFAKANNLRVHGHTLFWAKADSDPQWLKDVESSPNPRERMLGIMQAHITEFAKQFGNDIKSLDVINEGFEPDASKMAAAGYFRDSVFLRTVGTDWMELAIKMCNIAMPNVKMFYNDYQMESGNSNRLNAVSALKGRCAAIGATLHGVGLQMHTHLDLDIDVMRRKLREYADLGLLVHISELDVVTNRKGTEPTYTPEKAKELAVFYKNIFESYEKAVPAAQRWGITMWSVSDGDNYMNQGGGNDFPMLIDANYQPKEAYYSVLSILKPLPNNALIYQDFELKEQSKTEFFNSYTEGSVHAQWTIYSKNDSAARAEVTETGLNMAQTQVNVFNHVMVDSPVPDYILSAKTGQVFNFPVRVMHLAFRYQDSSNMFSVQAYKSDTEDVWRLVKRVADVDTILHTSTIKPVWGQVVTVMCKGPDISYAIDNDVQFRTVDSSFQTAVKVGFKFKGHYNADKYSSWKSIKVDPIATVADEFLIGPFGNVNGRQTNSGTTPKNWVVTATGTGNNGMEVTSAGLKAITGTSIKINNATVDAGVSDYLLSATLARTVGGYTDNRAAILLLRVKDITNFFYLQVNNSSTNRRWVLIKRVNDVNTTALTSPFDANDGDRVKVITKGATISIYVNDVYIGEVQDVNFTTQTKVGFRGRGATDDYSAWSNIRVEF